MYVKIFLLCVLYYSFISCGNEPKQNTVDIQYLTISRSFEEKDTIVSNDDIKLDLVEPLDESKEKNPAYINSRIKQLSKSTVEKWCEEAGFETQPDYILFRVFKHEQQFEIWGRNGNKDKLKLIKNIQVCALELEPGPKLKGWDYNTAEGFYTYGIYYTSPSWYMWIKLNEEEMKNAGMVDYGSCFKMFINYPNKLDRVNSRKIHGLHNNNGTICIHGNCVTACCVSFENKLWIVVFAFGLLHNKEYGLPHVYLFPCRFDRTNVKELFWTETKYKLKDSVILYPFWENIKEGYFKFEKEHLPLKFRVDEKRYYFD